MTSKRIVFVLETLVLSFFLITYFIAAVFNLENWCRILSPLNAFTYTIVLIYSYIKSDHHNKVSITLLFYSAACFIWGVADVIWLVLSILGEDPVSNPYLWTIYALTNLTLVMAVFVFAYLQFSKWNLVQICIDAIIITLFTLVLFWVIYLNKDIIVIKTLMQLDFTSVFSIVTSMLISIFIISWFLSIRSGKIPLFMRIISSGVLLYAIVDLLFYYFDLNGLYKPYTLIDFSYVFSFYVIAFGAFWKTYWNRSTFITSTVMNFGRNNKWYYLLLYPLGTILIKVFNTNIKLDLRDIITYFILVFLYWAFCRYVQLAIENERLLKREIKNNEILEKRVAEQVRELIYWANQDSLTNLYNRRYLNESLDKSMSSILQNEILALLLIDLDRFKTINDSLGHDAGDKVLIEVAKRLADWNKSGAIVARLGGDEFALMFIGKYTKKDVENFCTEIIKICSKPISIDNSTLEITISVGVSLYSSDSEYDKTLMKNADIAMYRAKSQGYNKYHIYDPIQNQDTNQNNMLEVLLKQADIEKEFELFYQPQFSLPDMKLIGAEALIRWKNAEHGYIPPSVFIPVAEETDLINKIGRWVIQKAISQVLVWNSHALSPIKIGVNISPKQLKDEHLSDFLKALISDSGINPSWLDAEITENIMLSNEQNVNLMFEVLKNLGISVSIDDFGSGYSSLGYLNKYSFDRIKLDKSLIDNVTCNNISGTGVVKAAISMAKSMGIKTIAEGVETQEQLDILIELGCNQVQGYLVGRPVPAEIFEEKFL